MYMKEKIEQYRDLTYEFHGFPSEPISDENLQYLLAVWKSMNNAADVTLEDTIPSLLRYKNSPYACGCLGAQNGAPWCPCDTFSKLETYRFDLALHVLENGNE